MDISEPLLLPAAPAPARRTPLPKLAALVPLAGGVVMWAVTGSLLALCLAGLGPAMMLAGVADGARQRRRESKKADADAARAWERVEAALEVRQETLRQQLRDRTPDVRSCLRQPPLSLGRLGRDTPLLAGRGEVPSGIRVSGGEGERAEAFRARAARLERAPVAVALGGGVCVRGPRPLADAVARALLVQLCLRHHAGRLVLEGAGVAELGLGELPHARRRSRAAARLAVAVGEVPAGEADAAVVVLPAGADVPDGLSVVLDCAGPREARLRTREGEQGVSPEVLSRAQVARLAQLWPASGTEDAGVPESLALADLPDPADAPGLQAVFARGAQGDLPMDLVADGPHAIVTGMTGAGKSELLISWVVSLAAAHGPEQLVFVLADFKGGTAFEPLRTLPHVGEVVTDLDGDGAERGVQSLRAELRRREEVLARVGARDVGDPAVSLPRLVIVVDEFAALLHEHPGLGEVFTDIAARGRALGMHLILGTQRAAGVVREALAANCPMRLSLRVTDTADSRAVVGVADAAELPGDPASRGLAIARRPQDREPCLVRIALTGEEEIERVRRRWEHAERARSPWLPALPTQVDRGALPPVEGALLLGLADEPARQRQHPVTLRAGRERGMAVFGGPESGKSNVLALLAEQEPRALRLPVDPEEAWDAVSALADGGAALPPLLMIDDLDVLLASFPADYSHAFAERIEATVRRAGAEGASILLTASRATAVLVRIADLLPRRALLSLPSRAEHVAAGGSAESHLPRRPAGRAHLDGVEVQFARAAAPSPSPQGREVEWMPSGLTALVSNQPQRLRAQLAAQHPAATVLSAEGWALSEQPPPALTLVVDDGEGWQRHWAVWQRLREGAEVLVAVECPSELRTLLSMRELPPYARSHRGRFWVFREGGCTGRARLGVPAGASSL